MRNIFTKTREATYPSLHPAADSPPTTVVSTKVLNETSTEKNIVCETSTEKSAKMIDQVTVLDTLLSMKEHLSSGIIVCN